LDENGNKLVFKPYPMFKPNQGKKKGVQLATKNIYVLEKTLGKKKTSKKD
jgi:hypothetical protein